MSSLFLLQHLLTSEDSTEIWTYVGVYSAYCIALAAINRNSSNPIFHGNVSLITDDTDGYPDGFYITEYLVDKDNWEEGFSTWDYSKADWEES